MKTKIKVAFVINSMKKGGAERVVSVLSNYLSAFFDVFIITLTNEEPEYELNKKVKYINLANGDKKNNSKVFKKIISLKNIIVRRRRFIELVNKNNIDLLISFLPEASFFTLLSKKNIPVIVSDRNDPNIEYNNKLYYILMKYLYPKANGFVFQTNDAKKYFEEHINIKNKFISIIFNPVNPLFVKKRFSGVRDNVIVSVGRLNEQKNQELLIDAFSKISKEYKKLKLIIYGEGPIRDKLEKKISDLNLENKVLLPGVCDNIQDKIYKSKAFIMTSNYEGIPNALIEAMSLGLSVISTDCPCGGPRMFIKDGINGYLIGINDINDLIIKLKLLLDDDNLNDRLGNEATKIHNIVKQDKIVNEWKKIIIDTTNKRCMNNEKNK